MDIPEEAENILIPAFIIQPIVENSVQHARPADRKLTVCVRAYLEGADLYIIVQDNGVGMSEQVRQNIMHAKSDTGLGIAIRNIKERVTGYFGPENSMNFESTLGKGTMVTLFLKGAASKERE